MIDVALNTLQAHQDYVGIICTRSNVHDIVTEAIENARFVCEEHYAMFKGPPVQLICPKELTFPYVPGHLWVIDLGAAWRCTDRSIHPDLISSSSF